MGRAAISDELYHNFSDEDRLAFSVFQHLKIIIAEPVIEGFSISMQILNPYLPFLGKSMEVWRWGYLQ